MSSQTFEALPFTINKRVIKNNLSPAMIGICVDSRRYSPLEKGIEFFSGGNAHHVFLVINETTIIESRVKEGVVYGNIKEYQTSKSLVLLADPVFLLDSERDEVVKEAEKLIGKKYDHANILGKMLKLRIDRDHRFICSEVIAQAYFNMYRFLGLLPDDVTPADIVTDVTLGAKWYLEYLIHTKKEGDVI